MPHSLPQRVPQNAPGDFYVQANCCTRCCMPHGEAPDLMNDPNIPFEECYFRRQPKTPEEVDQAINAICVSEMCALRYGGRDPEIIRRVGPGQSDYPLDETPWPQPASEERKVIHYTLAEPRAVPRWLAIVLLVAAIVVVLSLFWQGAALPHLR